MKNVFVRAGLSLAVIVLLAGGVGWFTLQRQFDPPGPDGAPVRVVVPMGSSTQRIATILDEKGVVTSARTFRLYVRIYGGGPFQAGNYTLRRRQALRTVVATLNRGPEVTYDRLTLPEGLTLPQIAERVGKLPGRSAERFLAAAKSGQVRSRYQPASVDTLEGLLFPDTYQFERDDDETVILRRLVTTFDRVAGEVGIDAAGEAGLVTPYQAIIVASLVEREARVPDDRGPIARVVYNRLRRDMLLQIDATVLYALGSHKNRVLFRDLKVQSPYNTYVVKGLPPTPIAAPGRAALEAALDPPPSDYLYYVVVEANGRHAFASTGAGHAANIRLAEQRGVR